MTSIASQIAGVKQSWNDFSSSPLSEELVIQASGQILFAVASTMALSAPQASIPVAILYGMGAQIAGQTLTGTLSGALNNPYFSANDFGNILSRALQDSTFMGSQMALTSMLGFVPGSLMAKHALMGASQYCLNNALGHEDFSTAQLLFSTALGAAGGQISLAARNNKALYFAGDLARNSVQEFGIIALSGQTLTPDLFARALGHIAIGTATTFAGDVAHRQPRPRIDLATPSPRFAVEGMQEGLLPNVAMMVGKPEAFSPALTLDIFKQTLQQRRLLEFQLDQLLNNQQKPPFIFSDINRIHRTVGRLAWIEHFQALAERVNPSLGPPDYDFTSYRETLRKVHETPLGEMTEPIYAIAKRDELHALELAIKKNDSEGILLAALPFINEGAPLRPADFERATSFVARAYLREELRTAPPAHRDRIARIKTLLEALPQDSPKTSPRRTPQTPPVRPQVAAVPAPATRTPPASTYPVIIGGNRTFYFTKTDGPGKPASAITIISEEPTIRRPIAIDEARLWRLIDATDHRSDLREEPDRYTGWHALFEVGDDSRLRFMDIDMRMTHLLKDVPHARTFVALRLDNIRTKLGLGPDRQHTNGHPPKWLAYDAWLNTTDHREMGELYPVANPARFSGRDVLRAVEESHDFMSCDGDYFLYAPQSGRFIITTLRREMENFRRHFGKEKIFEAKIKSWHND